MFKRKTKKSLLDKIRQFIKIKSRRPVLKYLETHLVDHCNLKCKACTHFCPVLDEFFVSTKDFEKSLLQISKKISFKNIRLLGGEPLLHPEVSELISISRRIFPKSKISIVTNAILLKDMQEKFWQSCRLNDVSIDLSLYPPFENEFEEFKDLINSNGVKVGHIHECTKMYVSHNPKGNSDVKIAHKNCVLKNYKILKGTKIYPCPNSAYINQYNLKYGLKLIKDEGIDIATNCAKKIIQKTNMPINCCRFCSYVARAFEWEYSSQNKDEWNVIDDVSKIDEFHQYILKKINQ